MMKVLKRMLMSLLKSGNSDAFITIANDPYLLQLNPQFDSEELVITALSNVHLIEEESLSNDQIQKIEELGYEMVNERSDYFLALSYKQDQIDNIVDSIVKTVEIYGFDLNRAEIELEE